VKSAIDQAFAAGKVEGFLKSLKSSSLRIREYEKVLKAGKLGKQTEADYNKLDGSDQGQLREYYLASLEKVDPELREKFFKLYSYY